jgi:large exoprotein involved in heme utilization and adhesion
MRLASSNSGLYGKGQGGDINIKTTGDITIAGSNKDPLKITPFNISVISNPNNGIGDGGKISIETPGKLSLDSSGSISSGMDKDAQGTTKGIKISAGELNLTNFGLIASSTFGKNPGGDIEIVTKGAVNIVNFSAIQTNSAKISAALNVPGGKDILSSSTGEGKAGNISIASERLNLNLGLISAIGNSDSGGNITLNLRDKLLLRNGSEISTSSGENLGGGTGGGNGGNITINSPLIVALPPGNGGGNDIIANAFTGKGGNVNITSQGLFGIQYRPKGSDFTNDITASSDFGLSGNVQVNTPGVDPGKDSTELPKVTTDASNQISQVCSATNRQNKLTVAGRGGLPPTANDPLTSDVIWQDARAASRQPAVNTATIHPVELAPPAVGWVFNGKKVTLIAAKTNGEPTGTSVACPNIK